MYYDNNVSTNPISTSCEMLVYEVQSLETARDFLTNYNKPVILTNRAGSTRYYGMRVLDYTFQTLCNEFKHIIKIIINVEDDNAALFTAIKMNYRNITYSGKSKEILLILDS